MTALFLRVKSLNVRSMRGVYSASSVVKTAAIHNLREFNSAPAGPPAHIDISKTCRNYRLRGPARACEVDACAVKFLREAGVTKYRKDATMAIEVLVSLPFQSTVDQTAYFSQAVTWAEDYFRAPILSAIVHLDEAAPHCHILILPLICGRLNGGRMAGGPTKLRAMHENFYQEVGRHFGLKRFQQKERASRAQQYSRGNFIVDVLTKEPTRMEETAVRNALAEILGRDPELICDALGIELLTGPSLGRQKTFVEIMTRPVKP